MILGLLAEGRSEVHHFLEAEDCLRTARIVAQLGATVIQVAEGHWLIEGVGKKGVKEPEDVLDAGNSGTTTRLIAGVLASHPIYAVLTGDSSLRRRPMRRVAEPLRLMGARIDGRSGGDYLPLTIHGDSLKGIRYELPVASAQVKSCLLLAGLKAEGTTELIEPIPSRDHTERMLAAFGAKLKRQGRGSGSARGELNCLVLEGGQTLQACEVSVPGDFSSAAFFLTAALLLPGSDLVIERLGINPTRIGLLEAFAQGGAHVHFESLNEIAGEPIATVRVRAQPLRGMRVGGDLIPRLIDEIPILTVAATQADGETVITDAGELRVKESDRLRALTEELLKMGAEIEEREDGLRIWGPTPLIGNLVSSHGDHRIAMALAIAGLIARKGETIIQDTACIQTSFPAFPELLHQLVKY